jgi:hypothetical protein
MGSNLKGPQLDLIKYGVIGKTLRSASPKAKEIIFEDSQVNNRRHESPLPEPRSPDHLSTPYSDDYNNEDRLFSVSDEFIISENLAKSSDMKNRANIAPFKSDAIPVIHNFIPTSAIGRSLQPSRSSNVLSIRVMRKKLSQTRGRKSFERNPHFLRRPRHVIEKAYIHHDSI